MKLTRRFDVDLHETCTKLTQYITHRHNMNEAKHEEPTDVLRQDM